MPELDPMLKAQLEGLCQELDRRAGDAHDLDEYYDGDCPFPQAVVDARITRLYRALMPMAEAPWGSLIVDSVQDRLEVTGIRSDDERTDGLVWGTWQDNQMDAESKLGHNTSLVAGRSFALVWPDESGEVRISLDGPDQMVVQYRPGSRRDRVAALRRWVENKRVHAVLYRPDGLFKFRGQTDSEQMDPKSVVWEHWEVEGEEWPLPNPTGKVPVVELPVNRRLKPGVFGYARGEFAHCTGLIDRINLLTFLGLVVAIWMGFPIRGIIGDKILRDDEGNALAPFDQKPGSTVQIENPNAKTFEFAGADRGPLSIYGELDQLATITKTPRHYLPMEHGMANLSADAIRASEGGLVAKVPSHKASLGEGWEEVLRLAGLMQKAPVVLSPRAEIQWADHESRSLAERADAASKLKDVVPWQVVAEKALRATQSEISRWEAMRGSEAFSTLIQAANATTTQIAA